MRTKARKEADDYLAEARKRADEEYTSRLRALKERPLDAIKELGWDTQRLVDEVTQEGSPEWRRMKALEERDAKRDKELEEIRGWKEKQDARVKEYEAQESARRKVATENEFIAGAASAEKCPTLHKLYGVLHGKSATRQIIADAYKVVEELYDPKNPRRIDDSELAEYLEEQAVQKLAELRHQEGAPEAEGGKEKPATPKRAANGTRTLGATATSERRAAPKPVYDMSPDEERAALAELADAAIASQRRK